jgi:hypothetical protein
MYDTIICTAPLPKKANFIKDARHQYQTKSLGCHLETYWIEMERGLSLDGDQVPFSGEIVFYDDNCVGAAYGFTYTGFGEDYESIRYKAVLDWGKLKTIVLVYHNTEVCLSAKDIRDAREKFPDPEHPGCVFGVNMTVFDSDGNQFRLVASSEKEFCFIDKDDRFRVEDQRLVGRMFFNSPEDLFDYNKQCDDQNSAIRKHLTEMLDKKKSAQLAPISASPTE